MRSPMITKNEAIGTIRKEEGESRLKEGEKGWIDSADQA